MSYGSQEPHGGFEAVAEQILHVPGKGQLLSGQGLHLGRDTCMYTSPKGLCTAFPLPGMFLTSGSFLSLKSLLKGRLPKKPS